MPAAGEWSESQCLAGDLRVHGIDTPLVVVRNTGGGSSECCHYYPVAAPARVSADGLATATSTLSGLLILAVLGFALWWLNRRLGGRQAASLRKARRRRDDDQVPMTTAVDAGE